MSDNIPLHIQVEIIKMLPLKSLFRLRSVSKTWRSSIDNPTFMAEYIGSKPQPHHLLVRYADSVESKLKYISIVDDHTFPRQKIALTVPVSVNLLNRSTVVGSSHGLFCLYGNYRNPGDTSSTSGKKMIVIWNPLIRKSVAIAVPSVLGRPYGTALGFGVCPTTKDPKIVKITYIRYWDKIESIRRIPWQVQVFSLSSGAWRSRFWNLPRKTIGFGCSHVVINQYMYWCTFDRIYEDPGFRSYEMILSFDMISEEFTEIYLPDRLAEGTVSISKLKESLVVLESGEEGNKPVLDVWIMNDGTFSWLYTVNPLGVSVIAVLEFRNNGQPIIEVLEDSNEKPPALSVYEPNSNRIHNIGVCGLDFSFCVNSYMETLLLLDHPASISNDIEFIQW